jgi:hypothetical protein
MIRYRITCCLLDIKRRFDRWVDSCVVGREEETIAFGVFVVVFAVAFLFFGLLSLVALAP